MLFKSLTYSHLNSNPAAILLACLFLAQAMDAQCQDLNTEYDLNKLYPTGKGIEPIFIRESPMNEATVQVFDDGLIKIYHTPERYSDKVLSIASTDGGYTWSEPSLIMQDSIIWQYPRRTLIDKNLDIHLMVFQRDDLSVLHTKSSDGGITWTPFIKAAEGRIGAIRGFLQTKSGRLVFGFHRRYLPTKPPFGACFTSSVYSDDSGETWQESESRLLAPVYENYNGNNYGMVEPNLIELKDGRIWMLARTQMGYLYQSHSEDEGVTWSKAETSIFHSSNSPANLLRLPDGKMVVTWCNTVDTDIATFGEIYTHRDILHMAISDDDGRTWRGFREIMRIPSRNDQNDLPPRGDYGISYPNTSFTKEGKIILVNGQGEDGGGKAIWLVDPIWLYETELEDDFSQGLEKWSLYTFTNLRLKPGRKQGPQLLDDPTGKGGKVLHIRKSNADHFADAAVWNFPMGRRGIVEMRVKIRKGSKGCRISLADTHRHPNDPNGEKEAIFSYVIKENGSVQLNAGSWHTLKLKWDMKMRNCEIYLNDEFVQNISQLNDSGMGISYIRFKSLAKEGAIDNAGLMLDWIKVNAEDVYSLKAFE